jgi:hypothetical protein
MWSKFACAGFTKFWIILWIRNRADITGSANTNKGFETSYGRDNSSSESCWTTLHMCGRQKLWQFLWGSCRTEAWASQLYRVTENQITDTALLLNDTGMARLAVHCTGFVEHGPSLHQWPSWTYGCWWPWRAIWGRFWWCPEGVCTFLGFFVFSVIFSCGLVRDSGWWLFYGSAIDLLVFDHTNMVLYDFMCSICLTTSLIKQWRQYWHNYLRWILYNMLGFTSEAFFLLMDIKATNIFTYAKKQCLSLPKCLLVHSCEQTIWDESCMVCLVLQVSMAPSHW